MADKKLLGDKVEEVLKKLGADTVQEAYRRVTKRDCGCGKRKAKLNELHKRVRERMLADAKNQAEDDKKDG